MLCNSGFMHDVTFSYHGANGPESSITLRPEEVRHGGGTSWTLDNYSVWLRSSECSAAPGHSPLSTIALFRFITARCTIVQSTVLRSDVVCLSVCPSVCDVG